MNTILLSSGNYFDLLNPGESEITIVDIANALSKLCRYTGHCTSFYSVAQHSVLVSKIVPREYAMQGLLHDAAEAIIGDVSTPLKSMLPDYKVIEKRIEEAVFKKFGLPSELNQCVKHADLVLLCTEKRDLMNTDKDWLTLEGIKPLPDRITPIPHEYAKNYFIKRYLSLLG